MRIDLGAAYAYSAISSGYQARTNLRCATNFYNGLLINKKSDYAYEDDITYYLNASHAAQDLYLSFHTARLTIFSRYLWPLAELTLAILTILVYSDAVYVPQLGSA